MHQPLGSQMEIVADSWVGRSLFGAVMSTYIIIYYYILYYLLYLYIYNYIYIWHVILYLFVCLFIYLSIYLPIYPSIQYDAYVLYITMQDADNMCLIIICTLAITIYCLFIYVCIIHTHTGFMSCMWLHASPQPALEAPSAWPHDSSHEALVWDNDPASMRFLCVSVLQWALTGFLGGGDNDR